MRFLSVRPVLRLALTIALLLGGAPLYAQTALNSTTLSAAITDTTSQYITVASATGFTLPLSGQTQVYALIDKEIVAVRGVQGTSIQVARGQLSSRATTHLSGSVVLVGSPLAYASFPPSGSCTRTNLPFVPVILSGTQGITDAGTTYDCLGSQWVSTNAPTVPVLGSTVASATTIAATGTYFKVSGTTTIATITLPAGWAAGNSIALEPTGLWSTNTAGNILLATTGVVGKQLILTWNGTKWVPSY